MFVVNKDKTRKFEKVKTPIVAAMESDYFEEKKRQQRIIYYSKLLFTHYLILLNDNNQFNRDPSFILCQRGMNLSKKNEADIIKLFEVKMNPKSIYLKL